MQCRSDGGPMPEVNNVVVVGLGEVGRPLLDLISKHHKVQGVDVAPPGERISDVDVLHICFPFGIEDFLGEAVRYVQLFKPKLTIINSTVAVGTTRRLAVRTGMPVVNSPVRGKHTHMLEDLLRYTKFVGAVEARDAEHAAKHFRSLGMKSKTLSSPEATELAKLTETTYFGLLIAWAQQVERYCDELSQDYDQVVSFYDEINFLPAVKYFPGVIGGHCVMPNINILKQFRTADIVQAIVSSNQQKSEREDSRNKLEAKAPGPVAARNDLGDATTFSRPRDCAAIISHR